MGYPILWIENTFRSRALTEQLLSPELHDGTIQSHDFDLAVQFLPRFHFQYPVIYAILAGSLTALYGRILARPFWSFRRSLFAGIGLSTIGSLGGHLERIRSHVKFANSIKDPDGFARAMENVNSRTGGVQPLDFSIYPLRKTPPIPGGGKEKWNKVAQGSSETSLNVDRAPNESPDRHDVHATPSQPRSAKTGSRWDEIRTARSKVVKNSSWDIIRDKHERKFAATPLPR